MPLISWLLSSYLVVFVSFSQSERLEMYFVVQDCSHVSVENAVNDTYW